MLAYIEKILYNNWRIQHKPLRAVVDSGWTLEELKHKLQQDPHCDVTLLGPRSNTGVALAGVMVTTLPEFSPEEMHRQIINFIVADDQVSRYLLSARYY